MAGYKEKLTQDLDRWIAAGHVSADKRATILASIPDARRLDAATALAWVGGLLLGIAMIAFVAANWEALPRMARFALVLGAFLLVACAGAWASRAERPMLSNIALMIAAFIFAAAVGLTGQIFDIAGDPKAASYMAGAAGMALGLAGRSTGATIVGLVFIALGDFAGERWFTGIEAEAPWMLFAAPLAAFLALRWGSAPLAHASAMGILYVFGWFAGQSEASAAVYLFLSVALAAMAAGARWLRQNGREYASVFYGWFAMGALIFFAIAGYLPWFAEGATAGLAHRIGWLAASGATIALGRFDRHALVTGIGAVSLFIAIWGLLNDLGLDLMTASGVFLVCALVALVAGLAIRRRKADA